jgi:hypothetical protein
MAIYDLCEEKNKELAESESEKYERRQLWKRITLWRLSSSIKLF